MERLGDLERWARSFERGCESTSRADDDGPSDSGGVDPALLELPLRPQEAELDLPGILDLRPWARNMGRLNMEVRSTRRALVCIVRGSE